MRKPSIIAIVCVLLVFWACHLENKAGKVYMDIAADSAWVGKDSVIVILKDADGKVLDTLFHGKMTNPGDFGKLPAKDYNGEKVEIQIEVYQGGRIVHTEVRQFDGQTGDTKVVIIPVDTAASLDIKPDAYKLYLGGGPVTLKPVPAWTGTALSWTSEKTAVATVSPQGEVTPKGAGTALIRVSSLSGRRDSSQIEVVVDAPKLEPGADTAVSLNARVTFAVKVDQEYGGVAVFAWDLDGDGAAEDSAKGFPVEQTLFTTARHAFAKTGDITVKFFVRDGEGNEASATRKVKVAEKVPRIDSLLAGKALFSIKDSVVFTARVKAGAGRAQGFAWDFDGDGHADKTGEFGTDSAVLTSGRFFNQAGIFKVTLKVTDSAGLTVSKDVSVDVRLALPKADAGQDFTVKVGAPINLAGKATDSLDGRITRREWKIGDSAYVTVDTAGKLTFTAPKAAGPLTCRYRVTDDDDLRDSDEVVISVADSKAPDVVFLTAPKLVSINDTVAFSATAKALEGKLQKFSWDFGDGSTLDTGILSVDSASLARQHRFAQPGDFTTTLKVTDEGKLVGTAVVAVTVNLDRPFAEAGDDTTVLAGSMVNLHGVGRDTLGRIAKQEWKIGNSGMLAADSNGRYSFAAPPTAGQVKCRFRVTDDDGLAGEDSLTVSVVLNGNANLSGLGLERKSPSQAVPLDSAFAANRTAYRASVGNTVDSVIVTAAVADSSASLKVGAEALTSGKASKPIPVAVGENTLTVSVTAQNGAVKTYTVKVTREPNANANLSALSLVQGSPAAAVPMDSAFAPARLNYAAAVANAVVEVTLGASADPTSTVTVNDSSIGSGGSRKIALPVGPTVITVRVTAQGGGVKVYQVTVTRAPDADADLAGLVFAPAITLAPVFSAAETTYAASVSDTLGSLHVTAAAARATATVKVNGEAVSAKDIPLVAGANVIAVEVTAQALNKKTYKVTVTRPANGNADLKALAPAPGTLSPVFGPAVTSYTVIVAAEASSAALSPTAAGPNAKITVNGVAVASGSTSPGIDLRVGETPVRVEVTAENGAKKSYHVTFHRTPDETPSYGYVRLKDPALPKGITAEDFVFNSAGQPVTLQRTGTGAYLAVFEGLGGRGFPGGNAQVTSMGDSTLHCRLSGMDAKGKHFGVDVRCHDRTGAAADAAFSLFVSWPRHPKTTGQNGFALADSPSVPKYVPDLAYSFNSSRETISITPSAAPLLSRYHVVFSGMGFAAESFGNILVTSVGGKGEHCHVVAMDANGDIGAEIGCFSGNTLIDAPFSVAARVELGKAFPGGYVGFNGKDMDPRFSGSSSEKAPIVKADGLGGFDVQFPGLGSENVRKTTNANVQVTAVGSGGVRCSLKGDWDVRGPHASFKVGCVDGNAKPSAGAAFNAWFIW